MDRLSSYWVMDGVTPQAIMPNIVPTPTQKIVWSELVQVSETTSSVAMEKVGFKRCLDYILDSNVKVCGVATDRHTGITEVMRTEYPEIDHQYDAWHLALSVKKLIAKCNKKA